MRAARNVLLLLLLGSFGMPACAGDGIACGAVEDLETIATGEDPLGLGILDEADLEDWATMLDALETLWTGSAEQRLEVALDGDVLFDPLDYPDEELATGLRVVHESLRAYFAVESDEWILDRLACALHDFEENREMQLLFRDLLRHVSPNVRYRAVEYFATEEAGDALPELLDLWSREWRPWVRRELLLALLPEQGSRIGADCLRLLDSPDLEIALLAVDCVAFQQPRGALRALAGRSSRGSLALRVRALHALGWLSSDDEALAALIDATGSPLPEVQLAAVAELGRIDRPRADRWLLDTVARREAVVTLRAAALGALQRTADGIRMREAGVRGLDLREGTREWFHLLAAAHWYTFVESAWHPALPESCSQTGARRPPECALQQRLATEPRFAVVPPPGADSVRCWEGPARPGHPELNERILAGTVVRVLDWFELDGEPWVELDSSGCWVPRRQLAQLPEAAAEDEPPQAPDPFRVELDQFRIVMEMSELAARLRSEGFLRVIEPQDEVIGIRIWVDPTEPGQVERFGAMVDGAGEAAGPLGAAALSMRELLRSDGL